MSIPEGTRLGRYEIRKLLGAGGMGEVYLALDTRLERTVALKILPADVSADPQRMRRFEQEARAASALNHPNVTHIYEIEETSDHHFIAMEYIEGETLRQRMASDQPGLREAIEVAQQISAALSAAHTAGIIHRDIKPENVMIRRDGYVKVLDFGLAKLTDRHKDVADTEAPTKALVNTGPGTVMGTARYMSPEQARGREVDQRTDIWSLGVVLYECIAGRPPFEGATASDVITSILSKEPPPLARYVRDVPEALEWIVTKALTKERDERYQTAKEMLVDLRRVKNRLEVEAEIERSQSPDAFHLSATTSRSSTGSASAPPPASTQAASASVTEQVSAARTASSAEYIVGEIKRHKIGFVLGLLALAVMIGFIVTGLYRFVSQKPPAPDAPSAKSSGPAQNMKISRLTSNGKTRRSSISPDGKYAVYVMENAGRQSIWVRQVSTSSNVQIVPAVDDTFYGDPAFSRDGEYIYYSVVDRSTPQGTLYQIAFLGGTPRKLLTNIGTVVTFSPDGKQLAFVRDDTAASGEDQLIIANADGTNERKLTARKADTFFGYGGPSWSPDGKTIASSAGTYKGGFHLTVIAVDVETGTQKEFTSQKWGNVARSVWLSDGSGLVVTASEQGTPISQIWLLSYPSGEVRKVTNDLNSYDDVSLTADSSTLVATQGETLSNIWLTQGFDAGQAKQITTGKDFGLGGISWTPGGKIVYTSASGGNTDIWITETDGSNQKQLTNDPKSDNSPHVAPDGSFIIFVSNRSGMPSLWRMDVDGGSLRELTSGQEDYYPRVSPDGRWIFFASWRSGKLTLWKMALDGGGPTQLTDKFTFNPVVSPDGQRLACWYRDEQPGAPPRFAILSVEGGPFTKTFDLTVNVNPDSLRWSADGRSLLYIETRNGVSNIWSQPVEGGAPKQLTDFKTDQIFRFDIARDGKQLALARGTFVSDIVLISNFR